MAEKTLNDLGLAGWSDGPATITGIAVDSRDVQDGYLFAALPGTQVHGADFIQYALRQGAGAVLTDAAGADRAAELLQGFTGALIIVPDAREALAHAAAAFFGAQPGKIVAVTGTNGKTSVASFTRQIWTVMGEKAANLGTTGIEGAYDAPLAHTTPEPVTLHRHLAAMTAAGVTHVAMEASSHGLEQRRLDGVRLVAAGFTNFTQDHLDYHQTFDAYFAAKARLFDKLLPAGSPVVVNGDDPRGADVITIAQTRGDPVIRVGESGDCDLAILGRRFDATGQDLRFAWKGAAHQVRLGLIGGFQAGNALVAAGLAIASGSDPRAVFAALPHLTTVRGRMQLAGTRGNGASVFVDYAHTPDALATALQALRPHVMGRLLVVFGAGGDRDRGKRPLMGQAAADHADLAFVTDDNPRSEDPATIRAQVLGGCKGATEIGDRAEAILRAVDALGPGDALLIAGKGHETGQIVDDTVFPFDDAEQASVAIAALDGEIS